MIGSSIGNFDGVHLGHRALRDALLDSDRRFDRLVAVTFEPAPAVVLGRTAEGRILTASQRRRRLLEAGFDDVLELETTPDLLGLEPTAFLDHLVERLGGGLSALAEGPDFRFGRARSGSLETLRDEGGRRGFEVIEVPERRIRLADGLDVPARSSVVRRLLRLGRVEDAGRVLGRPASLVGRVVRGDQRGRTIDVPTANLDLEGAMLPGDGVYAGLATLPDGETRPAAISIGTKPTFEPTPAVAEVHVLDWDGALDDYGWTLEASLVRRLRGQERYDGLEPFLEQLGRDLEATRAVAARESARLQEETS
ncbi:MAG: riboflavin kinase [Planctomycetota bacterium]|nr:riboflavin kinase [Planctomycetota bacterium]MEE2895182.1 riboflavin kinase [Planctomycetota bacterium]